MKFGIRTLSPQSAYTTLTKSGFSIGVSNLKVFGHLSPIANRPAFQTDGNSDASSRSGTLGALSATVSGGFAFGTEPPSA